MYIRLFRTGWPRPTGCLKLQVIFRKRATNHRALLWKMTCKDKASYDSKPSWTYIRHFRTVVMNPMAMLLNSGNLAPNMKTAMISNISTSTNNTTANCVIFVRHLFWFICIHVYTYIYPFWFCCRCKYACMDLHIQHTHISAVRAVLCMSSCVMLTVRCMATTHRNTLHMMCGADTLQQTASHCNTLHHTPAHCNTLQHTATHCNTLQHTATHYNTLQHTATHFNTCELPTVRSTDDFCSLPQDQKLNLRMNDGVKLRHW